MKATIDYIKRKIEQFNQQIFGGRLPAIPVRLADSGRFMGQCVFKIKRNPDGTTLCYDFEMRINTRVDLPENEIEDIIIHEMIHYFIHIHQLQDSSQHGYLFKALMNSINAAHGRKISITHKSSPEQRDQLVSTRPSWHVIAFIRMIGSKTAVKVLPRVHEKVIAFYKKLSKHPDILSINLYLHNDPFFNRFPTSSSFRIQYLDEESFNSHIKGAHKLKIEGNRLIQC